MAVNCASTGCPMLRERRTRGAADRQLEEQVVDSCPIARAIVRPGANAWRCRRFSVVRGGFRGRAAGTRSREHFFAKYASALADGPATRS